MADQLPVEQPANENAGETKGKKKPMDWVWIVVRIAVLSYVGLHVLMFFTQKSLVFVPTKRMEGTPENAGLPYEAVRLTTGDDVELLAWYVPAPEGAASLGTILYCHGNAGNLSHRLGALKQFHRMGFATFIFDYRGYGESEGRPSEKGTYRDAEAAWAWLTGTRGVPPGEIVLFGRSLGAGVASWLAVEHTPRALVMESAFTSACDMGQELYPWLLVRLICRIGYNTMERMDAIDCPVLIAHSPHDEIIPFHHGQKLFAAAKPPKRWHEMSGDHNFGYETSGPAYEDALKDFMANPVAEAGSDKPPEEAP